MAIGIIMLVFFGFVVIVILEIIFGSIYAFIRKGKVGVRVFIKSTLAQFGIWDAEDNEYFIDKWHRDEKKKEMLK